MYYSVIMSGFGGQGVMLIGELLAHAAMKSGLNVTWMPSYGVEMRGGTARCTVVVSDEKIGSPIVEEPSAVIAMNMPSLERFQNRIVTGGLLMVNSTIVQSFDPSREDIEIINVPTQEIARSVGRERMANIAMLGAFLARSGILPLDLVEGSLDTFLIPSRRNLIPEFQKTLRAGKKFIEENLGA
ncbi:MAG: 2-oxoacid:ferredoxin oxidoreductase subunit gamma [Firmicutes bacterium]|jgi:2-oxoglutarate ferredoxin oxidoreductase subunit gamma|nr:2-oxoacid:ferredoxin oxidoreductase subunit gamma [Bacillota bacterium]